MRIFVTGAAGFIGSALVPELIQAVHQVLGLTRSEAGAELLRAAGAEVKHGNIEYLDSLRDGAAQSDGVIHLAFNHDFSQFQKNCDDDRGAAIREQIARTTGRKCSLGALYTTIDRLERKGLLKTWMGDATPQRGGRAKRMIRVTAKGVQAAKDFYDAVTRVSRGASWVVNQTGGSAG
jgi:hypothetical protein